MTSDDPRDLMRRPRFTTPAPYTPDPADLLGFSAGVLRLEWDQPTESFEIRGRAGRVYTARLAEIRTPRGIINTGDLDALVGLIVRSPDGVLSKVTGVERFVSMIQVTGASVGLVLVPVEEP